MEVRQISESYQGVFAKQRLEVGDVIIEESEPLIRLSPLNDEDEADIFDLCGSKERTQKLWTIIQAPTSVPHKLHGKYKGMVQAALCYLIRGADQQGQKILDLYHPSLGQPETHEVEIVQLAKQALHYIQENVSDVKDLDTLQRVMLIWSCNSFEEGRIYENISRINHSCNPNSVVVTNGEQQKVVAATEIAEGEEVTISYLGMTTLYADKQNRQQELVTNKHFQCKCSRCLDTADDPASWIPCPNCHKREGNQLDEDVQYDDEQNVKYAAMGYSCSECQKHLGSEDFPKVHALQKSVIPKAATFLRDYRPGNDDDDDDEVEQLRLELLQEQVQICSSVLGARHWTTNILLLLHLDHSLQELHGEMLQGGRDDNMDRIAECIDMLERLFRFVEGLGLKLDPAHLLSDVTIGVVRALVSLGDDKSKTYGTNWMEKITDQHLKHFGDAGMRKVGQALRNAGQPPLKKARHS